MYQAVPLGMETTGTEMVTLEDFVGRQAGYGTVLACLIDYTTWLASNTLPVSC